MRINLVGWFSEGFRCPDVEITLQNVDGKIPKVSLIQMPNGTGKTTTLELLKATLDHSAERWNEEKIRSFKRSEDDVEFGIFRVKLLVDDSPVTFELTLDFEKGIASYITTDPKDGGISSRWKPRSEIRKFLTPAFLKLFIFDGEFASDLFDANEAHADGAIDALCQLYLLDEITETVASKWDKETKKVEAKTETGLKKHQDKRLVLKKREKDLVNARKIASYKMKTSELKVAECNDEIDKHLSEKTSTRDEHSKAKVALETSKSDLSKASSLVMTSIRMPIVIHPKIEKSLQNFRDSLDKLRLPEASTKQFFDELLLEDTCICGREMTEGARKEISLNSKQYLDAEESGFLNALKSNINDYSRGEHSTALNSTLKSGVEAMKVAKRDYKKAIQAEKDLKKKLIASGDEELAGWEKKRDEHETANFDAEATILRIDEKPIGDSLSRTPDKGLFSLSEVRKRLKECNDKIARITDTVILKQKTDTILKILKKATNTAREKIRSELMTETNSRLETVLQNDPIRVGQIDHSLKLVGQSGASAGQTLSVGYTFLMSALNRGKNDFPLVVDSPAGPIERVVRSEIARLIPSLCNQFVGFTINVEHPGFVPELEKAAKDCLFLTLFRQTSGTRRLMSGLPSKGVTKTANAVLVNDRDYFINFDMTDEV